MSRRCLAFLSLNVCLLSNNRYKSRLAAFVIDLETMSNNNLKLSVASLVSLEDWADEYGACGHPALLHRGGPCTQAERESPDLVCKIWTEFKRRVKPILATLKAEYRKEVEQSVLLDGLN